MQNFDDMSSEGLGETRQARCRDKDGSFGEGTPAECPEVRERRAALLFNELPRSRRPDRVWARHARHMPTWRAAAHRRGLAT